MIVFNKYKIATVLILVLLVCPAFALDVDSKNEINSFKTWLAGFVKEAKQSGISDETINKFVGNAEFLPKVIKLDRTQPDKTKTFNDYLKGVTPESRIKLAREKFKENEVALNKIGREYGVQPRFIVALWAIESDFGRNMGGFAVVNSLATLAFEGRRAEFFRKELLNALKIIDDEHINFLDLKGSWAGAMGQSQFMPSSFLELAVDYNKDGKRDIWDTKEDVFASVANYLSTRGWDDNITWGREIRLPQGFDEALIGKDIEKNLEQWKKLGIKKLDGTSLPAKSEMMASVIKPEKSKDRAFLVYSNYKVLLDWNRSLYFATGVGMLADSMAN